MNVTNVLSVKVPNMYKDRRREGETLLRQCQLVQLHLLYVVDRICRDNGLVYLLCGGTLIGAMRHNGFIPWDDDLDIGMPRKDYKKFISLAPSLLPEDVLLQTPEDAPRTAIPFAKVRDRYSFYGETREDITTGSPNGIYIDIFPYDDVPNVGFWGQMLCSKLCGFAWMRSRFFYNRGGCNFFLTVLNAIVGLICQMLYTLVRGFVKFMNVVLPSCYVIACLENGHCFRYDKRLLYPTSSHKFEDGEFPIPNDADTILTAQYGDWRKIPPPSMRPRHARIIDPFHAVIASWAMEFPN